MSPTEQSWSVAHPLPVTARSAWSTEDELLFVTSLGAWGKSQRERAPLLRCYLAACAHRHNWGHIDMVQVQLRVERLLAEGQPDPV
jgi:hypothetical protein